MNFLIICSDIMLSNQILKTGLIKFVNTTEENKKKINVTQPVFTLDIFVSMSDIHILIHVPLGY